MRILVAGATGAIGRRLVPQLVAAGHAVTGLTRSPAKVEALSGAGAAATVVDALDFAAQPTPPPTTHSTSNATSPQPGRIARFAPRR